MIGEVVSFVHQEGLKPEVFNAADAGDKVGYGTMVLDGMGRIRSCGERGERIFGTNKTGLIGRGISEFIGGLCLGGSSPSFSARYLVYLCGDGEWRRFDAVDAAGRRFVVEINLSRIATSGQEIFLLNVRRPEEANGA